MLTNSALPHSSCLFQVIGDHQADATAGINTFAVKYGEKDSLRLASILIILTLSLPIIYELLNLSLTLYLNWHLLTVVKATPFLFFVLHKLRGVSEAAFKRLS